MSSTIAFMMLMAFGGIALLLLATVVVLVVRRAGRGQASHPRCGNCGYNLTASESNRCPECGMLFIEAGVHHTDQKQAGGRRGVVIAVGVGLLVVSAAFMTAVFSMRAVASAQQARAMAAQAAAMRAQAQAQQQFLQSALQAESAQKRAASAPSAPRPARSSREEGSGIDETWPPE